MEGKLRIRLKTLAAVYSRSSALITENAKKKSLKLNFQNFIKRRFVRTIGEIIREKLDKFRLRFIDTVPKSGHRVWRTIKK